MQLAGKPSIIFEVGASSIKIIEAAMEKDRIVLNKFSIIPLIREIQNPGITIDIESTSQLIKNEIVQKHYKAKAARGVVSGEGIISREVMTPKVSEHELSNIIALESGQYFPVDLSNYVVDYKIITDVKTNEGEKYKVYVVAVPQKLIDIYVEIARKCKLMLEVIDINGNAFSKLLDLELKTRNELYGEEDVHVGIDIGASASYIVFNHKGKFQFGREIKFGVNDITHILAEYLGLDFKRADETLKTKIKDYLYIDENDLSLDEEIRVIGKDIGKILRGFSLEVNKIIEFYQARYSGKNIKKIYLTGGGVNIEGIDEFLAKNVSIECSKLAELKCVANTTAQSFHGVELFLTNVLGTTIRSK